MTPPRSLWSDEDLDRAWDELNDSTEPDAGDALFAGLVATARYVVAYDDIPPARPAFIRQLQHDLYGPSEAIMRTTHLNPISTSRTAVHEPALLPPPRRRAGWRAGAEFAVVAAVIAAMVIGGGVWLGFPSWGGSNGQPPANQAAATVGTPLPAPTMPPPVGMFQGDVARTNQMPGPGPVGAPSVVWKIDAKTISGPVVAGNRLFTLQMLAKPGQQAIVSTDLKTGATLWTTPVNAPIFLPTPTAADGLIFAIAKDTIVALDQGTGKLVWTYQANTGTNNNSPAVANGLVYVTFRDNTLRAIDAQSGKEVWRAHIPESTVNPSFTPGQLAVTNSSAVAGGVVYTMGNGGLLLASDAADGHQLWTFQADGDMTLAPTVANGVVIFVSSHSDSTATPNADKVQAVDVKTGVLKWSLDGRFSLIAAETGAFYLVDGSMEAGLIRAVDAADGHERWNYQASGGINNLTLANGVLYFSVGDGSFAGLDIFSQRIVWSVRLGVGGNPIAVAGLLVIGSSSAMYALNGTANPATAAASTPIDLSGLPPCNPPRTVPAEMPSGTPAATLKAETKAVGPVVPGTIAQILVSNLPQGDPAAADDVAGITRTLADMANCMPPAGESDAIAGFFTDDFFRRGSAAGGSSTYVMGWPKGGGFTTGSTVVLGDGRIALVQLSGTKPVNLLIFVQQNGRWLIDERYLIVSAYTAAQG